MKRQFLIWSLVLTMVLALSACGGSGGDAGKEDDGQKPGVTEPLPEEMPADAPQDLPAEPEAPAEPPVSGKKPESSKPVEKPAEKPSGPEKPAGKPEAPKPTSVDLTAFYDTLASGENWPSMMAVTEETLDSFYAGLSAISTEQCGVYMAMISASGVEISLVEVSDSADVQAVKDIFQARVDDQVGTDGNPGGAWYPAPTEMWKNQSRIVSNGNYVMLVATDDADTVVEAFNGLFA